MYIGVLVHQFGILCCIWSVRCGMGDRDKAEEVGRVRSQTLVKDASQETS